MPALAVALVLAAHAWQLPASVALCDSVQRLDLPGAAAVNVRFALLAFGVTQTLQVGLATLQAPAHWWRRLSS